MKVFQHWSEIAVAVCDHLLSRPEMYSWALHLDRVRALAADDDARRAFALEVFESRGLAAEDLYRDWVALLGRGASRGYRLGWWWALLEENAYFTPEGALLLLGDDGVRYVGIPSPSVPIARFALTNAYGDLDPSRLAARLKDPLPLDRDIVNPLPASEPAFRAFRLAAREVRASHVLRATTSLERLQSPRFDHRLNVIDAEGLRQAIVSSEEPR